MAFPVVYSSGFRCFFHFWVKVFLFVTVPFNTEAMLKSWWHFSKTLSWNLDHLYLVKKETWFEGRSLEVLFMQSLICYVATYEVHLQNEWRLSQEETRIFSSLIQDSLLRNMLLLRDWVMPLSSMVITVAQLGYFLKLQRGTGWFIPGSRAVRD